MAYALPCEVTTVVTAVIFGAIISALCPFILLPFLRRIEAQRLTREQLRMRAELEKLEREMSVLGSHLAEVRKAAERASLAEGAL